MNKKYIVVLFYVISSVLMAIDLPVFYRPPMFKGDLTNDRREWITNISARYSFGDTRSGRNHDDRKTALFSYVKPVQITALGLNVDDITSKPVTNQYWGATGTFLNPDLTCDDGLIDFHGKMKTYSIDLMLKQNLMMGFFCELFLPMRSVRIRELSYTNRGAEIIAGVNVDNFMQGDFKEILRENCYKLPYDECFSRSEVTELVFSIGWQGYEDTSMLVLDSIAGSLQLGGIVPISGRYDYNKLFAIPLGYDHHWGVYGRLCAEATLMDIVVVGGQISGYIFFPARRDVRMKTSTKQSGIVTLGFGKADVDYGSMWDLMGYIKLHRFAYGLSGLVGYSFSAQERTILHVDDCAFLKAYVEGSEGLQHDPVRFISKDCIVNRDERYHEWNQHVMHIWFNYDPSVHGLSAIYPFVSVEAALPLYGERVWTPDMFGFTAGFACNWGF